MEIIIKVVRANDEFSDNYGQYFGTMKYFRKV